MIIFLKNKHTLKVDDFQFRCSIGKNGIKKNKKEGDKSTPKGTFRLNNVYYRPDRVNSFNCAIKKTKIKKNMGWCDDPKNKFYNKLIKINSKIKHEKLFRKDKIYDLLLPINYNTKKPIKNKGSAIFIHLTKKYEKTLGCISIKKKDFLVLLKVIDKKTKIKIL